MKDNKNQDQNGNKFPWNLCKLCSVSMLCQLRSDSKEMEPTENLERGENIDRFHFQCLHFRRLVYFLMWFPLVNILVCTIWILGDYIPKLNTSSTYWTIYMLFISSQGLFELALFLWNDQQKIALNMLQGWLKVLCMPCIRLVSLGRSCCACKYFESSKFWKE